MRFGIQTIFFYASSLSALIRYGLTVLCVAATSLATIHIPAIGEKAAFLLFFFGIIQVSFWLGVYPGMLATILSLASANLLVLLPGSINADDLAVLNAGFCFVSAAMVVTTSCHRRLAEALWQSRQDLAHAQTVGQIGSWRLNVGRNELTWSEENHRIFGIPESTAMSYETFLAVVHPDDREFVDRMWQAGLRGEPYDIEHRLVVAGKVKWVREKAVLEFDQNGTLLGGFGTTQDITQRKGLQEQLAKVAASVPGLICSFRLRADGSACMPYASSAIESIYGIGLEVLAHDFSPVFARIHPDDIGRIHESIAESARSQQPWRQTYRYYHPDKGEVWHEGHSMPIREADGGILWHGYVHCVTERIRAEKALQERIERYELVLNGAQDAIWDWDVPNHRVHFSSRWKALRGFAENEVGNSEQEWSGNIHPDDLEQVSAALKHHFDGRTPVFCEEYRIRCKDGSWKWILDRGIAQKDGNGTVVRMAGSESDITARKLAENALRDREVELRLIMDATPALIAYLDLDFRYLRVNATYEKWFGISAEQILGRKAEDVIGTKAWELVSKYLHRARLGEPVSFDQQIPYGNGVPRWVHASYVPNTDVTGIVKGVIVHVFDIEERVLSEQKITILNQRLQQRIEEMQVIFNTVPIGLAIADDISGCHIRGNPTNEQMLGLPPHSELSMRNQSSPPYSVMQNGEPLTIDQLPMQRAIRGEKVTNQIMDIVLGDGQIITVLSNATPLFDLEGAPRGAVGAFMDITALNRAAETVRNGEAFVRDMLNSLPEHVAVLDERGVISAVNEPWERFATENGGSPSELAVGANYLAVCRRSSAAGDPDAGKASAGLEALLAGRQRKFVMEYSCPTRERTLWFLMHAKPVVSGVKGVIVTHTDITEHKLAEVALRESEARLALVIGQVKAGYWDLDLITRQLFLSPEVKQQIGFDNSELPNRKEDWENRLHPDDRALVLQIAEECITGIRPSYEAEFRLLHRDGHYRWFHSRGVLLKDPNNRPYRMLGINLDTTEYMKHKQFNEQRDKMEQSFRLYVAMQTAAAIAHELNQPLTAISSYADVALHMLQTGSSNRQKFTKILENCSTQAQRAGEVIRQLLALLQKEEIPSERLDINLAVREAIDLLEIDPHVDMLQVETDLASDLPPVTANAMQIQKVLINLLRNGLESMQEGGESAGKIVVITRRSALDSAMAQVTVQDSGKGVADSSALRKIFQPFYTTKPKGLGMGLAISRSLIAAHGGKMWAEENASHGLSIHFTLTFAL